MKRSLMGFAAAAVAGALLMAAPAFAQTQVSISIHSAPPAAKYERVPAPRRGYVWAPGYWGWNGHRHVWQKGHWERARPGYAYQRAQWQRGRDGWHLRQARWERQRHVNIRADQDRDGIPNRRDRDRDGDGVVNRHDYRPANPYRY